MEETRASRCAKRSQDFFYEQRAEEIMQKCEQVSEEKGHRSLILSEKDNVEQIVNILIENGFMVKVKNDTNTTYINW
jgi:hypothetical protein